jgi:hypothetical protein
VRLFWGRSTLTGSRRIHVEGVPADLLIPRGWPIPTDKWVRDNALWNPPPGWTPVPNASPAPAEWSFWTTNKLWWQITGAHFQPIRILLRLSNWLSLAGIALLVAGALLDSPGLRAVGVVVMVASLALGITHEVLKARMAKTLLAKFAVVAERGRRERLTREYQRYLTAMA